MRAEAAALLAALLELGLLSTFAAAEAALALVTSLFDFAIKISPSLLGLTVRIKFSPRSSATNGRDAESRFAIARSQLIAYIASWPVDCNIAIACHRATEKL